jgi:hypothetical protein
MKRQKSSRQWLLLPFVFNPATTSAFTLLITNHRASTRLYETTTFIDDEDFLALMDESVLLYSKVQHLSLSTDKEIDRDLQKLREAEVTALVEDIVYAQIKDDDDDDDDKQPATTTLYELGQKLDQAMLNGYQSTFTQEELDEWVHYIQSLYSNFESKLAAAASSDASEPATTTAMTTTSPLESLQTRLEQLRTLIAPTSLSSGKPLLSSLPLQPNSDSSSKQSIAASVPSGVVNSSADQLLNVVESDNADNPDEKKIKESFFFATSLNEESNSTTTTTPVETATREEESSDSTTSKKEESSSDSLDAISAVVSFAALGMYYGLYSRDAKGLFSLTNNSIFYQSF